MKQHPFHALLLLVLLAAPPGLAAQNNGVIHLITSIDAVNSDISAGCQRDYELATELFGEAAHLAGMSLKPYNLHFDQRQVRNFIDDFRCESNDVVIFLYSGHGFSYDEDGDQWPWPYLYCCDRNAGLSEESCEVDLEDDVYNVLVNKGARMTLVLGNSCNDPLTSTQSNANAYPYEEAQYEHNHYLKGDLFARFAGNILASACSKNQGSYTNIEEGSYFVVELARFIIAGLESDEPGCWEGILEKTQASVRDLTNGRQVPQFRIRY